MIPAVYAGQEEGPMIRPSLTALGALLLGVVLFAAPAPAAERPTETRIDLFDKSSNRTGSAIVDEKTGRVDFYERRSNRTGYGLIDRSGRIDTFDTKGNRTGSGQVTPGATRPGGRR
jgi:hypothetical protein